MPTRSSKNKPRIGFVRWITYMLGRVVTNELDYLPLPIAHYLGCCIGWCAWKLMPKRRIAVARDLELVSAYLAAEGPDVALDEQICDVFLRVGANMLSSFWFARMPPAKSTSRLFASASSISRQHLPTRRGGAGFAGLYEALGGLGFLAIRLAKLSNLFGFDRTLVAGGAE